MCFALALILASCGGPSESRIGEGVHVSGSHLPSDLQAMTASVVPPRGLVRLSTTLRLGPAGPLQSPVTVTIPLTRAAPAADVVVVATTESRSGPWTYLSARLSSDRKSVSFTATHFSWYDVLGIDVETAFDEFKSAFLDGLDSDATMTVSQPSCSEQNQARSDGYSITSSTTDTVYWCFGMSSNDRVLTVVNDRHYPLQVAHPELSVLQGGSIDWAQLSSLSHWGSGQTTIIAPGDKVTYQVNVPAPGQGGIKT
jgi:uncharacterized protein YcfL